MQPDIDPWAAKLKKTLAEMYADTGAHHTRRGDRTKEIVFAGRNKSDEELAKQAGVMPNTIYRHRVVLSALESLITDKDWTAEKDILADVSEPELACSWLAYLTVRGYYQCRPDESGNRYKRSKSGL